MTLPFIGKRLDAGVSKEDMGAKRREVLVCGRIKHLHRKASSS